MLRRIRELNLTMIEYNLIVVLISVVAIALLAAMGTFA